MTGSFSARELGDSTIELDIGVLAEVGASFEFAIYSETEQRFKDMEGWSEEAYYFMPLSISHDTTTKLTIARGIAWGIPLSAPVRIDFPGLGYSLHGEWPITVVGSQRSAASRNPIDPVKLMMEELSIASRRRFASSENRGSDNIPAISVDERSFGVTAVTPSIIADNSPPSTVPLSVFFRSKRLFVITMALAAATAIMVWQIVLARQNAEELSRQVSTAIDGLQAERSAHLATQSVLAATKRELASKLTNQRQLNAERERDQALSEATLARSDLQREREAHAATKERLGAPLEQLETERGNSNSNQASPTQPKANVATDRAGLSECDSLAANPNDLRRVANGVPFPELRANALAAIEACDRAIAANPYELRFQYQKARALHAANDGRATAILQELMRVEYPAAFDNAAQLLVNQNRFREADNLYRRGVALGDPDSMIGLADLIRAGKIAPRTFGEDFALYERAASLGHKGAQNEVEKRKGADQVLQFGLGVAKEILSR
ncbi:hypothetical protein NP284_35865 [Rhodopseudomonas pseudopalustris]